MGGLFFILIPHSVTSAKEPFPDLKKHGPLVFELCVACAFSSKQVPACWRLFLKSNADKSNVIMRPFVSCELGCERSTSYIAVHRLVFIQFLKRAIRGPAVVSRLARLHFPCAELPGAPGESFSCMLSVWTMSVVHFRDQFRLNFV